MAQDSKIDILLLGATGFTGKLVAKYLSKHPERAKFTLGFGARSKAKLEKTIGELGLDGLVVPIIVDVLNQAEVNDAVKHAKVVVTTVGPYWNWGTNVIRACANFGVHYVDLNGETPWLSRMIKELDFAASKSGAIIVPSSGFDSIPSDLLVHLSAKTLKEKLGPSATIDSSISAFKVKGGFSGGTLSTALTMLEKVPRDEQRAANKEWTLSPIKGVKGYGPKLLYTLPGVSPPIFGSLWVMARANKAIVQRTWGLRELAFRRLPTPPPTSIQGPPPGSQSREVQEEALEAEALTYGPDFKYDEFMVIPGRVGALVTSLVIAVFGLSLALLPPARWLLKRFATQAGDGPSEETQKNGWVKCTNITTASENLDSVRVQSTFDGKGDPGYSLTAVLISESALALLLEQASLPALGRQGGILTPASALGDVLVRRLEASGRCEFTSVVLTPEGAAGEEARKTR